MAEKREHSIHVRLCDTSDAMLSFLAESKDWLKREPITAIQALAHIRCMRLAARIDELRHEG